MYIIKTKTPIRNSHYMTYSQTLAAKWSPNCTSNYLAGWETTEGFLIPLAPTKSRHAVLINEMGKIIREVKGVECKLYRAKATPKVKEMPQETHEEIRKFNKCFHD